MAACGSYGNYGGGGGGPGYGLEKELNAQIAPGCVPCGTGGGGGGPHASAFQGKTCGKFKLTYGKVNAKCVATVPDNRPVSEKYDTGKRNPPCPAKIPQVYNKPVTVRVPYRAAVQKFRVEKKCQTKTLKKRVTPGSPGGPSQGSCLSLPPRTLFVDITYQKDETNCVKIPYTDYVTGVATKSMMVKDVRMVPNTQQCPVIGTRVVMKNFGTKKIRRDCQILKPEYKWVSDDMDADGVDAARRQGGGGGGMAMGGASMGGASMGAAMGGASMGGASMGAAMGGASMGGASMGAAMGGASMGGGGAVMGGGGMAMGGASMGGGGGGYGGGGGGGGISASIRQEFNSIDTNNDGKISAREYAAARGGGGGGGGGYGGGGGRIVMGGASMGGGGGGGGMAVGGASMGGASMGAAMGGASMGGASMGGGGGGMAMGGASMGGGGGGGTVSFATVGMPPKVVGQTGPWKAVSSSDPMLNSNAGGGVLNFSGGRLAYRA